MPEPVDLAACLERVARGDQEAARGLVERCYPLVLKLVRAHRSQSLGEEDLAQEVFLKMFARLDRYRPRDGIPFEHWLSRLAVRTCLDALRAERRRPRLVTAQWSEETSGWLGSLWSDDARPPVDEVLAAEQVVDLLLAQLAPRDRLVLTLLDLEDRSVAEVSRLTGWSATLVKVRAFRARRRLRGVVEQMRQAARP